MTRCNDENTLCEIVYKCSIIGKLNACVHLNYTHFSQKVVDYETLLTRRSTVNTVLKM